MGWLLAAGAARTRAVDRIVWCAHQAQRSQPINPMSLRYQTEIVANLRLFEICERCFFRQVNRHVIARALVVARQNIVAGGRRILEGRRPEGGALSKSRIGAAFQHEVIQGSHDQPLRAFFRRPKSNMCFDFDLTDRLELRAAAQAHGDALRALCLSIPSPLCAGRGGLFFAATVLMLPSVSVPQATIASSTFTGRCLQQSFGKTRSPRWSRWGGARRWRASKKVWAISSTARVLAACRHHKQGRSEWIARGGMRTPGGGVRSNRHLFADVGKPLTWDNFRR